MADVMADLPSGTVTFLMTDIEGSTKLLERLGDVAYQHELDEHRTVIRAVIARRQGHEVHTEGDALFAVFEKPSEALAAAIEIQQGLTEAVRVRIGLHTGDALVSGHDYVGVAVHRTARIRDAAHGGQILVSAATAAAAGGSATLLDLGSHRLKDLGEPERLHQVCADGLPETFPRLRTLEAGVHNLPLQRTTFVGREDAIADLRRSLASRRLVTLTGIGGCGKTRLALQVAAEAIGDHPDGVFFVDLGPVSDPALVGQTAAVAAGLMPGVASGASAVTLLVDHLEARRILFVLDNCEHVLDAAAELADTILNACPNVTVLATSRELLAVAGEQAWGVPSLTVPEAGQAARESHAVRLFGDRAAAVRPDFELTPDNEAAVVEICRRLDGIPLAIELAAARVTHLSPRQIADRLDDRFHLLTGARRRVQRQQTLQAAMDWSYDLLDESERVLLRRLTVFVGGFPLEAAEGICGGDGLERAQIVDGIGSLVGKSLVVTEGHGDATWYRLLETVRAYAEGKLAEARESERFREAHRDWYFALIMSPPIARWDAPLMYGALPPGFERHDDNVRAAIEWTAAAGQIDLIAKALVPIARILVDPHESVRWVELVGDADGVAHDDRLTALSIGSWLAMVRLDPGMDDHAARVIELAGGRPSRALANALLQRALFLSSAGQASGNEALAAEATRLANQAIDVADAGGWPTWRLASLLALGQHLLIWERNAEAVEVFEAATRIPVATLDPALEKRLQNAPIADLVLALYLTGARDRAAEVARRIGGADDDWILRSAYALAHVMALVVGGAHEEARRALRELVSDAGRAAVPLANTEWFVGFAALAMEHGDYPRAARLLAAARALGAHAVIRFRSPASYAVYRHCVRIVRAALGPDEARSYRDEGRAMSTDEALSYALEEPVSST